MKMKIRIARRSARSSDSRGFFEETSKKTLRLHKVRPLEDRAVRWKPRAEKKQLTGWNLAEKKWLTGWNLATSRSKVKTTLLGNMGYYSSSTTLPN